MRRVLVVTPGEEGGGRLKQILEEAGFQVIVVKDAEASLRALYQGHPDLVIMSNDSLEGQEITSRIADSVRIPIIVVGKGDELSTAVMIELGADMYLIEPISPGELVARVHALLRRYRGANPGAPRLDPERTSVEIGHNVVELTPTEFRLFSFFAMNPGKLIPYSRLLEVVWGGKTTVDTLHTYVRRLKEKLQLGGQGEHRLVSHRGEGYCFISGGTEVRSTPEHKAADNGTVTVGQVIATKRRGGGQLRQPRMNRPR